MRPEVGVFGVPLATVGFALFRSPGDAQQSGSHLSAERHDIGRVETRIEHYDQALGVVTRLTRSHGIESECDGVCFFPSSNSQLWRGVARRRNAATSTAMSTPRSGAAADSLDQVSIKNPRARSAPGLARKSDAYATHLKEIEAIPAATLRPVEPSILSGCSENELALPPIRTLAPAPTPTLAWAVAPP